MVRIGTPDDVENFVCVDDGWLAFELHKAGFQPAWKDEDCLYFKKTRKLERFLNKKVI